MVQAQEDKQIKWGILSTATICEKTCPAIQSATDSIVKVVASRSKERA